MGECAALEKCKGKKCSCHFLNTCENECDNPEDCKRKYSYMSTPPGHHWKCDWGICQEIKKEKYEGKEEEKYEGKEEKKYDGKDGEKNEGKGEEKYEGKEEKKYDAKDGEKNEGKGEEKYEGKEEDKYE